MNSFPAFLSFLTASIVLLFLWPDALPLKGLLLVLWSAFCVVRGLWMAELVFFGQASDMPDEEGGEDIPSGLAGALRSNRGKSLDRELSYQASCAFTDRGLIVMALGGLYLLWAIYMIWGAQRPEAWNDLSRTIGNFISREGGDPYMPASIFPAAALNALADISLAGLVFLATQSFSASYSRARLVLALSGGALFLTGLVLMLTAKGAPVAPVMSLAGHWVGYGYGAVPLLQSMEVIPEKTLSATDTRIYEMGMGGTVYLYALGAYFLLSFLAALARGVYQKTQAVLGIAVLLAMIMADHGLPSDPRLEAFWLAGWSALAVLFVQCRSLGHKSARLRQL